MRMDKLTIKSREAIEQMQHICASKHHSEMTTLHLLSALCAQPGTVTSLLERLGVKMPQIKSGLDAAMNRLPRVSGTEASMARELVQVLEACQKLATDMRDEYVSTEHMILAMMRELNS